MGDQCKGRRMLSGGFCSLGTVGCEVDHDAQRSAEDPARTPGLPKIHELKTWVEPFTRVIEGVKRHEIRKNDRQFMKGDTLWLREWDHTTKTYTGRDCEVLVTWISYGGAWGLPEDLCVMSIDQRRERATVTIDEALAVLDREGVPRPDLTALVAAADDLIDAVDNGDHLVEPADALRMQLMPWRKP